MTQNGIVLVVSVSIIQDNEVLIIKENKPTAQNKWNFPSGRIEQGEDILVAARREVKEETGFDVKLVKSTGVYNFTSNTNHQVILFHFIGEIIGGSLTIDATEIIDSKWITLMDLKELDNEVLRDAPVIKQITDALINEKIYPITFFREQLF
ncbi:NUDIX domain-containing protein [Bacillus sp. 1P10SD]|uniref:NUDIX hydrolase n=1 Tax=Bacillus sp. 1P10SD TaxID=3132265 RepID=UPI0039A5D770